MKRKLIARFCMPVVMLFVVSLLLGSTAFADNAGQGMVDLNAATVKELSALPGIGKKRAAAIVAYRSENGMFANVDDIKKIEGIGKKTFNKLKERLVVE